MRVRYPVWLVRPGEDGPGRHRLEALDDNIIEHMPVRDPDDGLVVVQLVTDVQLVVTDDDVRFPGGDLGVLARTYDTDRVDDEPLVLGDQLPYRHEDTDLGPYVVVSLSDDEVWIHEDDVPISNHPNRRTFYRRPPHD